MNRRRRVYFWCRSRDVVRFANANNEHAGRKYCLRRNRYQCCVCTRPRVSLTVGVSGGTVRVSVTVAASPCRSRAVVGAGSSRLVAARRRGVPRRARLRRGPSGGAPARPPARRCARLRGTGAQALPTTGSKRKYDFGVARTHNTH